MSKVAIKEKLKAYRIFITILLALAGVGIIETLRVPDGFAMFQNMIHIQSGRCCQIGFFTGAGISEKSGARTCLGSGFQTGNAC
jgi:hypothetical protein